METESITLFTKTGLHTFENLIDLNTLNLKTSDKQLVKAYWEDHLAIMCGLDENALESFINEHGYLIPSDWLDTYCTFIK